MSAQLIQTSDDTFAGPRTGGKIQQVFESLLCDHEWIESNLVSRQAAELYNTSTAARSARELPKQ